MRKKISLVIVISLLLCCKPAYAVIDFVSIIETALEKATEISAKIEEIRKFGEDTVSKAKQGFQAASSCFSNPLNCNEHLFNSILGTTGDTKNLISTISVMPDVASAINQHPDKDENADEAIDQNYVYDRNSGKSIENLRKNRNDLNNTIANEISILFAKGATTRHLIMEEEADVIYKNPASENPKKDDFYSAQNNITLLTDRRLLRILEMRVRMVEAIATAEKMQQSNRGLEED